MTEEDTEPDGNLFWDEMTVFSETSHEDGKDFGEGISDAESEPDTEGVFLANSQVRQATKQQMRAADLLFCRTRRKSKASMGHRHAMWRALQSPGSRERSGRGDVAPFAAWKFALGRVLSRWQQFPWDGRAWSQSHCQHGT